MLRGTLPSGPGGNAPSVPGGRRKDFWDRYTPQARSVLNDLLDKYTDHGVTQLDDLQILEVPPLSARGTPLEIASFFGGADRLRSAVRELQAILYAQA